MTHSDLEVALLHALKVKVVAEVRSRELKDGISIEELKSIILDNAKLLSLTMSDGLLNQAVLMVRSEIDVTGRGADVLDADPQKKRWYSRDILKEGGFWERFYSYARSAEKNLPSEVMRQVDEDSDKIVERLGNPHQKEPFNCRGMVFGDVQAGKTLSYSAVMNKACDAGYKVVIVLAGVTESLRSQTQERLDYDFVGEISTVGNQINTHANFVGVGKINPTLRLICRTDTKSDFKNGRGFSIDSVKQPVIIVAKKNISPLKEIIKWLHSQRKHDTEKVPQPILIIDDEADNASVNTGKAGAPPKTINNLIRQIIDCCERVTYLGYTATPFANIFISPDDTYDSSDREELFPKDFIVSLNAPSNYCGGKFYFLDKTSEYVICDIDDAKECIPRSEPLVCVPPSLKKALRQIFVASAIKDYRRENGLMSNRGDSRFDSCLINVAVKTSSQNDLRPRIKDIVDEFYDGIGSNQSNNRLNTTFIDLKKTFEEDFEPYFPIDMEMNWEKLYGYLKKLEKPVTMSINTKSEDQLVWKEKSPRKVIAIGGFTLSRGITLSGLTISYIYRNSKAADTIMQMGRMFGYRDGYRDLVRLWMDPEFADAFDGATRATDDLRNDIIQMNKLGMTPRQFGMKVSTYPGLLPTAKNKMQNSELIEMKVCFAGLKPESHCFFIDKEIEKSNKNAVINFTNKIVANYDLKERFVINDDGKRLVTPQVVFEGVDSNFILDLLKEFEFHPNNKGRISEGFFLQYIEELRFSELSKWDLIFYSLPANTEGKSEEISAILGRNINSQMRSIFTKPFFDIDKDESCIHLAQNRSVTTGNVTSLVTNDHVPTLLIQSLVTGEIKHKKGSDPNQKIPLHLQDQKGREFIGLKIFFPKVTKDFRAISFIATLDYLNKIAKEQADESEDDE
jgi:hypothetical protein